MKCKIPSTALKGIVKSMGALQSLGVSTKAEDVRCLLTVRNERLYVEGANMGAYIRRSQPVTMMREGSCGICLESLNKPKFSGDVVLEFASDTKKFKVVCARSKYELPTDQQAETVITAARPNTAKVDIVAQIPTVVLAEATAAVALKPSLKEEDLQIQVSLSPTPAGGRLEVVGIEHFSFGRYIKEGPSIKVKEPVQFVLQSSSSSIVLSEVTAEVVGVGVQRRPAEDGGAPTVAMVRMASEDAEVFYPTTETAPLPTEDQIKDIQAMGFEAGFIAYRKQLREAVSAIKPVQDSSGGAAPVVLIQVTPSSVQLGSKSSTGMVANAKLDTSACKVNGQDPKILILSEKYLSSVLALASDVVPLQVSSWGGRFASICSTKIEDGAQDYYFSQILPQAPTPPKAAKGTKK